MTVIADDSGPEASPASSAARRPAARPETTNVFLEAAYFDPIRTAATGRKLGINSDARYRFERGVDPAFVETGAEIGDAHDPGALRRRGLRARDRRQARRSGASPSRSGSDRVKTLAGVDIPPDEQRRDPRGARLRRRRRRRRDGRRGADLAAGHERRGGSRRGDRPRLRPRQGGARARCRGSRR